jgi:hypothetical protein
VILSPCGFPNPSAPTLEIALDPWGRDITEHLSHRLTRRLHLFYTTSLQAYVDA